MNNGAKVANDRRMLTVRVPMVLRKRGGRKTVLAPEGTTRTEPSRRVDTATIKTLARAFRWRKLIETGTYGNAAEIARVEGVNDSYVNRILRITLLAPDIVEAILDGLSCEGVNLERLMKPFPILWERQRLELVRAEAASSGQPGKCATMTGGTAGPRPTNPSSLAPRWG